MRFGVLGPLLVRAGSNEITVARRERLLLAVLLLHANRNVSVERVVDAIWADRPPANSTGQVHAAVYRLRKALVAAGASRGIIMTGSAGYQARVDQASFDLAEFRELRSRARAAAGSGKLDEARGLLRAALELWRGDAFDGIDSNLIRLAAAGLDEERLRATEECIDAELALGLSGEVVAELTDLVGHYPHRERLQRALMLALYRSGRQADALAAYRRARTLLNDELGLEPGPELQRLHQAILNRDPALAPPAGPVRVEQSDSDRWVVPRELPADVAGFTGRDDALRALDGLLENAAGEDTAPVVISAIAGTAGVGKTALAAHWAHRVVDRFPDGQLFVNLRGYSAGPPVRPIEALGALLRSLGTEPDRIPVDEAQAAGLLRSRLAGRRVLIVLDNARSVDQVRPLLPGSSGSFVLVTSRERLAGLVAREGARRLTLDVLTPSEAIDLLANIVGVERLRAERQAASELARVCAYLPLALRVAAATLVDRPNQTIGSFVAELTPGNRLAALDPGDDRETAVRVALDLSYDSVPQEAKRLFRLLGLVPGPDFTPPAAAALAGVSPDEARDILNRLERAHLVHEHSVGRYTFHDLLRLYARDRAETDNCEERNSICVQALNYWYLQAADRAVNLLYPATLRLPLPRVNVVKPMEFDDSAAALDWLDTERANLLATVQHAAIHGPRPLAWLLADRLRGYLWRRGYTSDSVTAVTMALKAAEQEGDLRAQAVLHFGLSDPHLVAGRYPVAEEHLTTAHSLARRANWEVCEAMIVTNLGLLHWSTGDLAQASDYVARAQSLHRRSGSKPGQAASLGNLGIISCERGQLRKAKHSYEHAMALYREVGSREGEAQSFVNLGEVCLDLGELDLSHEFLSLALVATRELGDRHGESEALYLHAAAHRDKGNLEKALDAAMAAVALATEIGDRRAEVRARNALGSVYLRSRRVSEAVDSYRNALDIARETRSRAPEIVGLIGLASALCGIDELELASQDAWSAVELARASGYRVLEGQALTTVASVCLGQRRLNEAKESAFGALGIHRNTGHRPGEARTLALLAHIVNLSAGQQEAAAYVRQALTLFSELGSPVPDELRELDRFHEP